MSKEPQHDFIDFDLPDELKAIKVSKIEKQGSTILVVYDDKPIRFDIITTGKMPWHNTSEHFKSQSKNIIPDHGITQKILSYLALSWNDLINNVNSYNDDNNNNTTTTAEDDISSELPSQPVEELSISEAIRRKKGYVKVKGQVIGHSSVYDMIVKVKLRCDICGLDKDINYSEKPVFRCPVKELSKCPIKSCNDGGPSLRAIPEYITTIDIELQDPDKFNEIERVKVRLFEDNTKEVFAGKIVMITGNIHVVRENENPSNKPIPVIYAEAIEDTKKEELNLTEKDIEEVINWKRSKEEAELKKNNNNNNRNIIDELVSYFAPDFVGYEHVKKGLLMVAANAGIYNNEKRIPKRLRINALLIGDPSCGKSTLLRRLVNIVPYARYESCQSSTGLSLTAQVSKEEGGIYTLRHGPIPLANGSVCALNEIGQMHISEHKHFLDCMQEGYFTLNKHGFNAPISANTSIIAKAVIIVVYITIYIFEHSCNLTCQ